MGKKIIYLVILLLGTAFIASSKEHVATGKANLKCEKTLPVSGQEANSLGGDPIQELSPVAHYLLCEI